MATSDDTQQLQVYDALRALILGNEFAPEERISERALCERLGATRGPVRESLIRLEGEGLIRKTPAHAYYVEHFSLQDKHDVYAVRLALERIAVRKAALDGTLEDKIALAVICEEERQAFAQGDEPARFHCDQLFHQRLVRASGSRILKRIFEMVTLPVLAAKTVIREKTERTMTEHEAICAAVRAGNADEAERLIGIHLEPGTRFQDEEEDPGQ